MARPTPPGRNHEKQEDDLCRPIHLENNIHFYRLQEMGLLA